MSGQEWWPRGADEMIHPDDSILLAYIRQQPLDESWQRRIYQHVAHCKTCQKRCKELRQTSALLDDVLLQRSVKPSSLSDVESEWEWVQSPQTARQAYQQRRQKRVREDVALGMLLLARLPHTLWTKGMPVLASYVGKFSANVKQFKQAPVVSISMNRMPLAMLVIACVIIFAYALAMHNPLGAIHPNFIKPVATPQSAITIVPQPTTLVPTKISTQLVAGNGLATPTPTSSVQAPTISICALKNNRAQNRLYVCGSGFKLNDKVELIIDLGSGRQPTRHLVSVQSSGSFQYIWNIYWCGDVPVTITAQLIGQSTPVAKLANIQYKGRCYPAPVTTVVVGHSH